MPFVRMVRVGIVESSAIEAWKVFVVCAGAASDTFDLKERSSVFRLVDRASNAAWPRREWFSGKRVGLRL